MNRELVLWQFIRSRMSHGEHVALLVVVDSSGSSPGRASYKMAVATDGKLCGSIGGGVMEVNLVEQSRPILSEPGAVATGFFATPLTEQVHRSNSPKASGMICSGRQTVIRKLLTPTDASTLAYVMESLVQGDRPLMIVTPDVFTAGPQMCPAGNEPSYQRFSKKDFTYSELLGPPNDLYIIGGGHCALALSELMSKLDFHITIFDDRSDLNTIDKNRFADEVHILENYSEISDRVPSGPNAFVVVMTMGYAFDEIVIRSLIDKEFKYFGVLGSKAKMAVLLKSLKSEGVLVEKLDRIHTPIGLPINSHTPEEIAVSIAAEIISVKNSQ